MLNSINNYSSISTRKGIGGLASGLDTDELVKGMTGATRNKITKNLQNKEILSWKTESYRSISSRLIALSEKYTSFSSETNLLGEGFFTNATITALGKNADKVNVSGTMSSGNKLSIFGVSSVASAASFISNKAVSGGKLTTGDINLGEEVYNNLAGQTLNLSYGGKTYNVKFDKDFTGKTPEDVARGINDALDKIDIGGGVKLSEKISASSDVGTDGKSFLKIQAASGNTDSNKNILIAGGSGSTLKMLGLKLGDMSSSSYISGKPDDTLIETKVDFNTALKGKSMVFEWNGIEKKITFDDKNPDGTDVKFDNIDDLKDAMQKKLDTAFGKNRVQVDADGSKLSFKTVKEVPEVDFNTDLKGKTMTFEWNGIEKKITFDDKNPDGTDVKYDNIEELKVAMQNKLDIAFGRDKVHVDADGSKLSFKTDPADPTNPANLGVKIVMDDDTSNFTFKSGGELISGDRGIFKVKNNASNRISLTRPISEVFGDNREEYKIKVNDKIFTFPKTAAIRDVLDEINASDAGVNIQYLSATDKFSVTASETGVHGRVEISDEDGDLGRLLGLDKATGGYDANIKAGTDAKMSVSYDGGTTMIDIVRSSNSFSFDGLDVVVNDTFEVVKGADDSYPVGEAITFSSKSKSDDIIKGVKEFVKDYNEILALVNKEVATKRDRKYAPLTYEQESEMSESQVKDWNAKAKAGMLFGDSNLQSMSTEMRFAFSFTVPGVGNISDFGITTSTSYEDNGKLVLDEIALKKKLEENPESVKKLFTAPKAEDAGVMDNTGGLMTRVKAITDKYSATTGDPKGTLITIAGLDNSLTALTCNLGVQMSDIDKEVDILSKRLKKEEDRYFAQFTNLEKYMAQMNSQSSWLTQQLGS